MTGSEGREALDFDHGYDGEVFYLGLALDPAYVEGFVEGCLVRIGEDDPEGEDFLRSEWEEGDKEMALDILKTGFEVCSGRPEPLCGSRSRGHGPYMPF